MQFEQAASQMETKNSSTNFGRINWTEKKQVLLLESVEQFDGHLTTKSKKGKESWVNINNQLFDDKIMASDRFKTATTKKIQDKLNDIMQQAQSFIDEGNLVQAIQESIDEGVAEKAKLTTYRKR